MIEHDDFDFETGSAATRNGHDAKRPAAVPIAAALSTGRAVRKGEGEAEQLTAPVRILGLDIVGFKRIKAVQFEVGREGVTVIGGGNAQGKSSCLEAVTCLLGGGKHVPDVPVHADDPRAEIVARLEDARGTVYKIRRIINPDRSGGLEITREDGSAVSRAQEFLSAMQGVLWFDPSAFLRKKPAEQADDLRRLLGLDFRALDRERQKLYDERTQIGRDRDRAKGHAEKLTFWPDAPAEEQTSSELVEQMNAAVEHNQEIATKQGRLQQGRAHLGSLQEQRDRAGAQIGRIEKEIANLQELLARQQPDYAKACEKVQAFIPRLEEHEAACAALQLVDTKAIAARLTDVETINRQVRDNAARVAAFLEAAQLGAEWDHFTGAIAGIDQDKRKQLEAAQMPVDGLAFDAEGADLLYNGYPLSQASGAEQMRVSVAVAMRMNGGLRLCLIDEGEKMDLPGLLLMDRTVRELGGQSLMARVSDGPECALVIEDGAVREVVAA